MISSIFFNLRIKLILWQNEKLAPLLKNRPLRNQIFGKGDIFKEMWCFSPRKRIFFQEDFFVSKILKAFDRDFCLFEKNLD